MSRRPTFFTFLLQAPNGHPRDGRHLLALLTSPTIGVQAMDERFAVGGKAVLHQDKPSVTKPVVLVGMMGVGKSTVGRKLAQSLDRRFYDADDEIERAAGLTISEIFEKFGEEHFRDGEKRVIARLLADPDCVIATGGGAFMQDQTRELILEKATAIWLNADLQTLVDRVSRRNTRPLLIGKDPQQVIAELAERRNPKYALAPIHVHSRNGPHQDTVDQIVKALPHD